jgi:hypothetical protein
VRALIAHEWRGWTGAWGLLILSERRQGHKVSQGVSAAAVGVQAAVGALGQEAMLSKSLCQLPVKLSGLTTDLMMSSRGQRTASGTHLVNQGGVGWHHGGVEDMHLLQLHVAIELLQLGGLHTLQLREVVLSKALELIVHVLWVEFPEMVCGNNGQNGVSQGGRAAKVIIT